jgi:hypothetical protein
MFDIIWNTIVDHIPWWVYMVAGTAGIGALFYFFSPILVPIWNMLPTWLRAALIGTVAAFLAWIAGRNTGRHNAEEEERRRNADAMRKRNEVDNAVDKKSDSQVQQDLRNRWSSDGDK